MYDYIIIGGGVTGLYLGYRFRTNVLKQDVKYLILEQDSEAGGRMQQVDFHGDIIQLGAGVIRDSDKNVLDLVHELELPYRTFDSTYQYNIPGYNKKWFNTVLDTLKVSSKLSMKKVLGDNFTRFSKYCNYTDFFREDSSITKKNYPFDDIKHSTKTFHSLQGGYCKLTEKLAKYSSSLSVLKTSCKVSKIIYKNGEYIVVCVYTSNGKYKEYKCKHVIVTTTITALRQIEFEIPDLQIVNLALRYIRPNRFLRMYTYHDEVSVDKPVLTDSSFKQVIPISKNVIMSAYCDNTNSLETLDTITSMDNNELTGKINNILHPYGTVTQVKDRILKFWECGTHYYKPGYPVKENFLSENGLSIVGEIVSFEQGWVEGSIHSANAFLEFLNLNLKR